MGNHFSNKLPNITGKIILNDGTLHALSHPTTVAELMLDHPQQVVVELKLPMVGGGNKLIPLPADTKLDMKKAYLMLPMNGRSTTGLSVDEARRILQKATTVLRSKEMLSSTRILPLFAHICMADVHVDHDVLLHTKESCEESAGESCHKLQLLQETFDERPEFLSRQCSGKMWKPSLDTIKEKTVHKKLFPHKLF